MVSFRSQLDVMGSVHHTELNRPSSIVCSTCPGTNKKGCRGIDEVRWIASMRFLFAASYSTRYEYYFLSETGKYNGFQPFAIQTEQES